MRLGLMLRPLAELLGSLTWKPLLCALLVMTLGGCVAFKGFPERPSKLEDDLKQLQPSISADKIKQCLGIMDPPQEGSSEESIKKTDTRATPPDEKSCRNQLVAARMYAIDLQFSQFEEELFRETRRSGFFATLATLGLTTTGALVSGGASQIMSGLAALTVGGREAFEKEVLADRTLIAIHTAMRAGRARVGVRLRSGLTQEIDEYPLAIALSDLNDYYDAGTILGALVGITESVGTMAREESKRLENVTRGLDPDQPLAPTPPATTSIKNAVTPQEKRLSLSDGERIQKALCIEADGDFGGPNSKTREAIKLFQAAISSKPTDRTGHLDNQNQVNILLGASPCTNPPYRNAYEKFEYPEDGEKIKELQKRLGLEEPKRTGKWDDDTRDAIKQKSGGATDALTPELDDKITS